MNRDGVSVAFELMLEEISSVEKQLTAENGKAFEEKRYDDASGLIDSAKRLLDFRKKLETLSEDWESSIDARTRTAFAHREDLMGRFDRAKIKSQYTIEPHSKGPKTTLRVLFRGKRVQRPTAARTFVDVVEMFGLDRVRGLGIEMNNEPLVSSFPPAKYPKTRVGALYVTTQSNTLKKKTILEAIAVQLGETISVEVV